MTLDSVARYEPDRVERCGDHAVVVGASVAGLLAGRVLADAFGEVSVLERDALPGAAEPRRGVPQGNHVHVLLEAGRAALESLLPGYGEVLRSDGGVVIDAASDLRYYHRGGYLAEGPDRLPMYCATRPLFERTVRERVAALDDVTLYSGRRCTDYLTDDDASSVEGVAVADGSGATAELDADLVVDATGRTSRTPAWLERHHYAPPVVDEVRVDLAYGTAVVERPPGDRRGFLVAPSPPVTRGGAAIPAEGGRWVVTLFGLHGDHPPADRRGFEEFAYGLPPRDVGRLLDTHPWTSEGIRRYPFPSSLRRRYEDLHRFPDGLLVTGDAVASFNPIYGQGMSVAALDALHLHAALAAGGRGNLAPRFFDRAAGSVDVAWRMAVGSDAEFDGTTGPTPRGTGLLNRYLDRLVRTAHDDGVVADRFARVLRLERSPTALVTPDVLRRVLAPGWLR